jgi:hypothetical protein
MEAWLVSEATAPPRALTAPLMTAVHARGRHRTRGDGSLPSGNSRYSIVAARNQMGNEAQVENQAAYCTPGSGPGLTKE